MPERPDKALQYGAIATLELPPVLSAGAGVLPAYAELHCISNFSFQRGASHPKSW